MKSIKLAPNKALMQVMKEGTQGNRSNVFVVCRKINGEVGEFKLKGKKPHAFTSLKVATNAWRKLVQRDGKDSSWVITTSNELARSEMIWL
jgi:hypothetical protein